jgi:uncharacterized Tic20 family protein
MTSTQHEGRATERLRYVSLDENSRNLSVAMHLTPLAGLVLAPLVATPLILWLIGKGKSPFVDDHGREVLNFMISYVIWFLLCGLTLVLAILIPVLVVVGFVAMIRGAIAAGNGEYFRYPMVIRFLS